MCRITNTVSDQIYSPFPVSAWYSAENKMNAQYAQSNQCAHYLLRKIEWNFISNYKLLYISNYSISNFFFHYEW